MKITPFNAAVPQAAQHLINRVAASLSHFKITEPLLKVDRRTDFSQYSSHLKTGGAARHKPPLLMTIRADTINYSLVSYAKLSWLQVWHIRVETYIAALAELVSTAAAIRSSLVRLHHFLLRWTAFQSWRKSRKHGPRQLQGRSRTR